MRRLKWVVCALALSIIPVLAWTNMAHALRFTSSVSDDETVNSSVYSAGKTIDINGTINGDVFCAGQTVTIDATVHGDVICAGQDVTIKGSVHGDVRVAGQFVSVDADIERSLTVAAQTFSLDASAGVGRDLTTTGDSSNIKGSVGRDALLNGNTITMNGPIGRDARATGANIELKASAQVGGNFTYTSERAANIAVSAQVAGETRRQEVKDNGGASFAGVSALVYLYFLAAFLLIALLLVLFVPQGVHRTYEIARRSLGKTILVGFLVGLAAPFVIVLIAMTFVGLPVAILALLAWIFLAVLSGPVAGYYLGKLLLKKTKNHVVVMLVGSGIVVTLYFVPYIGFIAMLLAYWIGSGATLIALKRHLPAPKYRG